MLMHDICMYPDQCLAAIIRWSDCRGHPCQEQEAGNIVVTVIA
jgi:hypothetical protein